MGLLRRRANRPGPLDLHVSDPRFDHWETVADFEDLETSRAFAGQLRELGIDAALVADWEPDRFGRGEIYLRVPPESYGDATVALDGLD